MNKDFLAKYTSLVGVYSFRVTTFVEESLFNSIVSQQSEKDIFTGVVSFCGATLFYLQEVLIWQKQKMKL